MVRGRSASVSLCARRVNPSAILHRPTKIRCLQKYFIISHNMRIFPTLGNASKAAHQELRNLRVVEPVCEYIIFIYICTQLCARFLPIAPNCVALAEVLNDEMNTWGGRAPCHWKFRRYTSRPQVDYKTRS